MMNVAASVNEQPGERMADKKGHAEAQSTQREEQRIALRLITGLLANARFYVVARGGDLRITFGSALYLRA